MTRQNEFIRWYNDVFKATPEYAAMLNTVEGSPWHRETNVGIHTDMVVMEYLIRAPQLWSHADLLGAYAAAFHDVGKPHSMQKKWKEERGDYLSFGGHEQASARRWENYAVENIDDFRSKDLDVDDIYTVSMLIELHKPWEVKRAEKLQAMSLTLMKLGVDEVFANLVRADNWGRISDDWEKNRANVNDWVNKFEERNMGLAGHPIYTMAPNPEKKPVLYVPIGASGTGKSTLRDTIKDAPYSFSLDAMRHELYGEDYAYAFSQSTKDKMFRPQCNDRFREMLRTGDNVFLDNTNTSKKTRRFYCVEARNRGYHLHAIVMPVALQTILDRQRTRTDKTVPDEAVTRQYFGMVAPQYGEFDEISVLPSNIL